MNITFRFRHRHSSHSSVSVSDKALVVDCNIRVDLVSERVNFTCLVVLGSQWRVEGIEGQTKRGFRVKRQLQYRFVSRSVSCTVRRRVVLREIANGQLTPLPSQHRAAMRVVRSRGISDIHYHYGSPAQSYARAH